MAYSACRPCSYKSLILLGHLNSARCPREFSALLAVCIFLKMEAGSLGVTPNSLCKAKSPYHFIYISRDGEFFIRISQKRNSQQMYISIFLTNVMHIIRATDSPLFCSNFARKCLILPAECSRPKSLILIEILPAEFIQA